MGLSLFHNRPQDKAEAIVAVGGEYARLRVSVTQSRSKRGGKRGKVRGFSRASRKRLLDLVNQLDRRRLDVSRMLFVTLTYPSEYSEDWRDWKRDLNALERRLRRLHPGICYIWRLEFQNRGAPHFHLLVLNLERIDGDWLSEAWYDVVGSGDEKHLQAGTQVRRVKSWRGVLYYLSKHIAKPEVVDVPTGRLWGVVGRASLPITLVTIALRLSEFFKLRRILRRWLLTRLNYNVWWGKDAHSGLTVYLSSAAMMRLLRQVMD